MCFWFLLKVNILGKPILLYQKNGSENFNIFKPFSATTRQNFIWGTTKKDWRCFIWTQEERRRDVIEFYLSNLFLTTFICATKKLLANIYIKKTFNFMEIFISYVQNCSINAFLFRSFDLFHFFDARIAQFLCANNNV